MIAAVVLENWKLAVFRKGLVDAGYSYTDKGEFPGHLSTTILHVEYENQKDIQAVLQKCHDKCAILKRG